MKTRAAQTARRVQRLAERKDGRCRDLPWDVGVVKEVEKISGCESHCYEIFSTWKEIVRNDPCCWCGAPGGTVDHIVPKSKGGPRLHAHWNSTGSCAKCNQRRGNANMLAYLILTAMQRDMCHDP